MPSTANSKSVESTSATLLSRAEPLVSVVIPTYNRPDLLLRALESARRQTYSNLEIIVVDDASIDETRAVVERFADPRFRYLRHSTNRGGSAARNTGIGAATGRYIAFLDDDDEWEPEKTELQLNALDRYEAVLCTSDLQRANVERYSAKETVELEDLRRGKFTAGGTGVLMAETNILRETMFDESLPRYQDWDLFIRIAMKHKIGYLNKPLVRYNGGAHGRITNSARGLPATQVEQQLLMLRKHREFFGAPWFRRHMSRSLLNGIKNRPDKMAYLIYTARKYGVFNVARALGNRLRAILSERLSHVGTTTR